MSALPSPRQLKYLVALSERLNFGRAAQDCFVTQSTLSAGLKELEDIMGVRLVERDRRTVRITPIGEDAVRRAREILARAQDLVELGRRAAAPLSGPLRLGVIPTIAPYLLPEVLPGVRAEHPDLRLFLREDLTARLLQRLRDGALDAALIALPYDTGELSVAELFRDEFWFVSRADRQARTDAPIPIERLDHEELVLLEEGHCLRDHVIEACTPRATGDGPRIEATSLSTLLQMVEGGLGTTLLPEMTLRAGLLKGTALIARPIAPRPPSRTVALAWRRTSPREADFRRLGEFVMAKGPNAGGPGIPALRRRRRAGATPRS